MRLEDDGWSSCEVSERGALSGGVFEKRSTRTTPGQLGRQPTEHTLLNQPSHNQRQPATRPPSTHSASVWMSSGSTGHERFARERRRWRSWGRCASSLGRPNPSRPRAVLARLENHMTPHSQMEAFSETRSKLYNCWCGSLTELQDELRVFRRGRSLGGRVQPERGDRRPTAQATDSPTR